MGNDEYHPLTQKGSNLSESGGIGYMIVDVIDTMQIMGLTEEYERARDWVANKLTFDRDGNFNTFEVRVSFSQFCQYAHGVISCRQLYVFSEACYRHTTFPRTKYSSTKQ